jgi:hypothetical protein
VSCSWTGTIDPAFTRFLLLRGQVGGKGRVVLNTTDTSASAFLDSNVAPGQYSYVLVELDASNTTLGHSNPVYITIPPAGG